MEILQVTSTQHKYMSTVAEQQSQRILLHPAGFSSLSHTKLSLQKELACSITPSVYADHTAEHKSALNIKLLHLTF